MLESLYIKNIALIKELNIPLGKGFTVFTGETGAGKSIIIDSIAILLGKNTSRELIRTGEESASVSAMIYCDDKDKNSTIADAGFDTDEDGMLYFQKDISRSSRSSSKLGGRSIPASLHRELISELITIHGQNDNQTLFRKQNHITILDSFVKSDGLLSEYSAAYDKVCALEKKIGELERSDADALRRIDMLRFQADEIKSAKLKAGEEQELEEKKKRLRSAEKIQKHARLIRKALYHNEKGVSASELTDKAKGSIEVLSDFYPELSNCAERLDSVLSELMDIAETVSDLIPEEERVPSELLDKIESRLNTIEKLRRKYGASEEEILEYYSKIQSELNDIQNASELIAEYKIQLTDAKNEAFSVAEKLSVERRAGAAVVSQRVCEVLDYLDMPGVRFLVNVEGTKELKANGTDDVEFLLSANPGEPLLPIASIASGGELSRIMLAIKSVLAQSDSIPTLIFDEIDTGISGRTSRKVGIKLKEISKEAQVICVTHSAQIASLADTHIKISKEEKEGRTETNVTVLSNDERVTEVARILGGIEVTQNQLNTAKELIDEGVKL